MNKHTPGPWKYDFQREGIMQSNGGKSIAQLERITGYALDPERDANGEIIAAAPDMYDFIREIALAPCTCGFRDVNGNHAEDCRQTRAGAIIQGIDHTQLTLEDPK